MKKLSISSLLVAAAVALSVVTDAPAQRRINPNRAPGGFSDTDPQFGRQRNRFPGDPRGVNRPPLGPQTGPRAGALDQNRKRELQRRLMQAIGLSDQQRMRMQEIRRSHEDEAIAIGRRIRQARAALDRAIMGEPYDEAAVRRATEELAAAQADRIRLEAWTRAEVRGVLTTDQVLKFHELERQLRREMRQQRQQEQQREQQQEMGLLMPDAPEPVAPVEEIDLVSLLLAIF